MRHLAVGDIHGCFEALVTLAAYVPFRSDDVVITLGDYVNRGPNTFAVLDWLIEYRRSARLVALRGNHEIMMLEARNDNDAMHRWIECGGDATLASYSPLGDSGRLADVPDSHWQFIAETRPWFETPSHFFVHANAYPDLPLEDQPEYMLYWEKFEDPPPHENGKIMVCGHSSQKSGLPRNLGHAVCIDTWACGKGWLSCLNADTGELWQTNQKGETRKSRLG